MPLSHVIAGSTTPLTCASGMSVRGYSRLDSEMPTPLTKSDSECSTSAPQKEVAQPKKRPEQPVTLIENLAPSGSRQPVLP